MVLPFKRAVDVPFIAAGIAFFERCFFVQVTSCRKAAVTLLFQHSRLPKNKHAR